MGPLLSNTLLIAFLPPLLMNLSLVYLSMDGNTRILVIRKMERLLARTVFLSLTVSFCAYHNFVTYAVSSHAERNDGCWNRFCNRLRIRHSQRHTREPRCFLGALQVSCKANFVTRSLKYISSLALHGGVTPLIMFLTCQRALPVDASALYVLFYLTQCLTCLLTIQFGWIPNGYEYVLKRNALR